MARDAVADVETIDLTIDLDRHSAANGRRNDRIEIEGERLALQQETAGRMAQYIHPRIFDGAQVAFREGGRFLAESRVH